MIRGDEFILVTKKDVEWLKGRSISDSEWDNYCWYLQKYKEQIEDLIHEPYVDMSKANEWEKEPCTAE